MKSALIVSPIFSKLLDVHTEASLKELRASIAAEGVRDPIIVWKGQNVIVDGHTRFKIATELKKSFKTIEMEFANSAAVETWMIRNQLGRRNLSPERMTYFIGRLYSDQKQVMPAKEAAAAVAEETGVSEKTVRRAEHVAKGVDLLAKIKGTQEATAVLDGKGDMSKADLETVGKAPSAAAAAAIIMGIEANKADAAEKKEEIKTLSTPAPVVPAPVVKSSTPPAKGSLVYKSALNPKPQAPVGPAKKDHGFIDPNYDVGGFTVESVKVPELAPNAALYIVAPDAYLDKAMLILKRAGFNYDCSFVFTGVEPEEGVWSKITHISMIVGTRGTVAGPKAGQEAGSVIHCGKDYLTAMQKIIGQYHK